MPNSNSKNNDQWFIYILKCGDGSLYTGSTNDLEARVKKHNSGSGAKYTRSHLPVILVYSEKFSNRSLASKREAEIKKLSRKEKLSLIKSKQ
ncbi:MAG: GIY-YIG nuclease family protein [Candidatus Pacebacteria bacterium]|jgi:putative endonuclease|nr:GIY-YIG nuclease family protein [Candidatus Paceibacterota bacterium]MBT4652205.1 GIY-YIG nuclease family protein [Candidatus Paceibacterota bacterium]MBT6756636.1 GIY-YIG nuclease family protein [Candidatus Paceibacterota bacterium]MBT6920901.1 GIY-YIG nuclease family protein [Candidatus Paceibacterota bacterium]